MAKPTQRDIDTKRTNLFALIFFAYLVTGYIGLHIHAVNTFAALVWPPSGIAFAAFILYGYRVWPGVFFAALLLNSSVGAAPLVALAIALGNTLGPLAGSSLIRWYTNYTPSIIRLRDNVGIVVNAFLIPTVTATIGTGALWLGGSLSSAAFSVTWGTWWIGNTLGILVCTPFILKWFNQPLYRRTRLQYIELAISSAAVAIFSYVIFWSSYTSFAYGLFIPLTWVALRTGPRGMTLSLLIASAIAISGTIFGHGPFVNLELWHLQVFLATMSVVFLVFTAVVEERKEALKTLGQHVDELETALYKISSEDEAKKEFLAVLAHELRNPLATVLNSIELIRMQGISTPNASKLLETINERARAMVRLLDDLLDISRISQKKLSLHKEAIGLDEFIDRIEQSILPFAQKHGHTLTITRSDEELTVEADPVRLEQIFVNLVTNAVKFTKKPGGLIDLTVRREKDIAVISVRDNGMGIPKNMLRRIFEPFFQINRGQLSSEGVGIGLPLTRQLVEMHGGTIEAKSAGLNTGSEFIVRLPLFRAARPKPPSSDDIPLSPQIARRPRRVKRAFKILVVDDNAEATDALAKLLELRGYATSIAYTGAEAVQKAMQFEPEIVLLDIGLPDMDGYEVARRLHAQKKPYFLIALTGYGQDEDKERARQAGIDYHLTKPAGLKEIAVALKRVPHPFGVRGV